MKKLNLWRIIVILCTLCILTKCKTYANDEIQILDTRFTDTDIDQNNQSNIYFDSNWNYWYWLLFLWKQNDDIQTQTTLQIQNWDTITCNKQLRWYYSTNYWNFHLLPIDSNTFQQIRQWTNIPSFPAQNNTSFTWWLFYDCRKWDTPYNWVYWHIKWTIGDFGNTQEIRAWIDKENNTWKSESPLKIVFYEWVWPNRALSWDARDSIGKRGRIIASFSLVNKIKIVIPDEYFYPNTAIYNENRDEIRFNDVWNNWYWLFFLGTWIQWSYNITNPHDEPITCTTQLNWYYTISFTDFGMFPLDQTTLSLVQRLTGTIWVSQSWWLYTNCTIWNTTYTTWVYWYIKWTYWMDWSKNIHEIRAWVDNEWNRKTPSPLEIIYSENFWNVYRSLSGNFHSSLIKNSIVENRFFGDMWLYDRYWNNIQAVWTLNDHHYFILYDDYSSDQMKIYTKSSMAWSKATIKLTWYDINWQQVSLNRNSKINETLENNRSNFGFYWLYRIDFPNDVGHKMRSWTINVTITNPAITFMNSWAIRSKTMDFLIQSETPKITITRDPEGICATGITVSVTATENATISYHITDSNLCDSTANYNFRGYTQPLSLTDDSYNNKYICIKAVAQNGSPTAYQNYQITNIDTQWPGVNFTNRNVNECTSITRSANATDTCAWVDSYSFSSISFGNDQRYNRTSNTFYLTINDLWNTWGITKTQTLTVKDNFWHETTISQNITISDVVPTVHNKSTDTINIWLQSWEYNFWNIFTNFDAKEWICPAWDLTGILNSCTDNAIWSILTWTNHNELLIRPSTNQQITNWTCTIVFIDNEQSKATWYVTFLIDTQPPTITIQNLTDAPCAISRTVKTTLDETGTILYYTGTSESCDQNWPYILWQANTKIYSLVFRDESDMWTYVCVKAIDLAWNINYSWSAVVTWIDRTPPKFDVSWNFEWNIYGYPDLYECETWFAEIINAQDLWCFRNSPISYSWDNSTFTYYNTWYSKYSENTATRNVKVKAQDYWLNQSNEKTITFFRKDRQIYFSGQDINNKTKTIHLSDMIDEVTVPNLIDAFNVTWRWSCETIVVTEWTCTNSTMNLNRYSLTITPEDDRDEQWTCEVTFKDCDQSWINCDNILTGIISFRVKTKDYFVVLESGHEYSKWHIKNKDNYIDYEKISLDVTNDSWWRFNLSGKYEIWEIRRDNSLLEDSRPEDTKLNIETKINYDDLDYSLCPLSWNFKIILDTWFITDPAWNPSEWKEIITDQSYELRPHICVSWNSNNIVNNNTFEYTEGTIKTWFEMIIYVTTGVTLSPWTGDILCTWEQNCPWFSCSQTWIVGEWITLNPLSTCNNGSEVYWFNKYYKLRIDPNESVDENYPAWHIYSGEKRFEWTWCKIQITTGDCTVESYTNINLKTKTSPYKFWSYGFEDFYDDELWAAIASWGWDNGFFFYMSNPQFVNRPRWAWLVWNINYEMDFSTWVADEFYHIEWTGIVNGYQESLKIKRPTFNYANPRGYLFNFPYYDSPDENY